MKSIPAFRGWWRELVLSILRSKDASLTYLYSDIITVNPPRHFDEMVARFPALSGYPTENIPIHPLFCPVQHKTPVKQLIDHLSLGGSSKGRDFCDLESGWSNWFWIFEKGRTFSK